MQQTLFGKTGMRVSRLALGAMGFGGKMDLDATRQAVNEALDAGVNLIDTAESYGDSENLLGEVLEGRREDIYLATKAYHRHARQGVIGRNARSNIMTSLERSLRRLRTDHVDLYQLHHPDPETPVEDTLRTLEDAVRQGKVRHIGLSNHYAWQVAWTLGLCRQHGWELPISLQCCYSAMDRFVEMESMPLCETLGVATMVYSPLAGGLLSGKYKRGEAPPEGSRGAKQARLQNQLEDDRTFDALEQMQQVADEVGVTLPQLAVMWLLAKPAVTVVILGASRPEHFRPMYTLPDEPLAPEHVQRVDDITDAWRLVDPANQPTRTLRGLSW